LNFLFAGAAAAERIAAAGAIAAAAAGILAAGAGIRAAGIAAASATTAAITGNTGNCTAAAGIAAGIGNEIREINTIASQASVGIAAPIAGRAGITVIAGHKISSKIKNRGGFCLHDILCFCCSDCYSH